MPRVAVLLTLIVVLLIGGDRGWPATPASPTTRYISLFPLVILTGMVERFWTLEAEDGTAASFKTLLETLRRRGRRQPGAGPPGGRPLDCSATPRRWAW